MILFTCLTLNLVNGDNTIGAHHGARGAADAFVVDGLGVVVTLTVYIFRQLDAVHRACCQAYAATFATLGVD